MDLEIKYKYLLQFKSYDEELIKNSDNTSDVHTKLTKVSLGSR